MILIGLDDTDTLDSPGTNQLAKAIVRALADHWTCIRIVRHQLLFDPRVPYTSKNGSASIALQPKGSVSTETLKQRCESVMRDWYQVGSDPGLCVSDHVPAAVTEFGRKCCRQLVDQAEAFAIAATHDLFLKGLGGTNGGVIGALAAIGLAATGDDGRVVLHGEWPDDLSGIVPAEKIRQRGIDILDEPTGCTADADLIDVGKHLRPNRRAGRTVLFVRSESSECGTERILKAVRMV